MGRLGKFYQENCLTEQAFVKEKQDFRRQAH